MSLVFVVNSGSSSLKYAVIDLETEETLFSGLVERIGEQGAPDDHTEAVRLVLDELGSRFELLAVGHRVVHGGAVFQKATVISDAVEEQISQLSALAPLHNPANLAGIRAARAVLPTIPHVAVFDTAFHATLPPEAYTYAIDSEVAARYGIRRYGFHGTSHQYVASAAARTLGRELSELKIIVLHLGNGASITAINGGTSIETSMGMTPLEGLVMGTRSGDIDPAVLFHLHREAGFDFAQLDDLLNRKSGLLGLSGTGDMRDVRSAAQAGDAAATRALEVYRHRIRKYLGAYLVHLGGLDVIVFTAGVGENSAELREEVLGGLEFLGIAVDPQRNRLARREARQISPDSSPVAVLVVPTNEELEIARQVARLVLN